MYRSDIDTEMYGVEADTGVDGGTGVDVDADI